MHAIQSHILSRLIEQSPRRFSELKPQETESNLFMYHLGKLIQQGTIEKSEGIYTLTPAGKQLIDQLSSIDLKPRIQPKVLTDIICRNEAGEWLLFQRSREPFRGMIGFPSGKIHLGESMLEAATRELQSQTGYIATLLHYGNAYMTTYQNNVLNQHVLTHVFLGEITGGEKLEKNHLGHCFWAKLDQLDLHQPQYFPGLAVLVEEVNKAHTTQFFNEYTFNL